MDIDYFQSTGFRIRELSLISKTGVSYSLTGFYQELNIFDSILHSCVTGNILISDSAGLSSMFLFDGNDFLKIHIGKVDQDILVIEKTFRIYKQSDRTFVNQNTEKYILHFISEEFVTSLTQPVGPLQFEKTYTEMAKDILQIYLKSDPKKITGGQFDDSLGIKTQRMPEIMKPMDFLNEISKLAIDEELRPCFLFYENLFGFNFASLTNLLRNESICTINFNTKNLNANISNDIDEFTSARYFKVIQQYDFLNNIKNGVYSGKFIGHDKTTEQRLTLYYNFDTIDHPMSPHNNGPAVSNPRTVYGELKDIDNASTLVEDSTHFFASSTSEIENNTIGSFNSKIGFENISVRRKSIFTNLFSQRVKLVIPGNFAVTSGVNVNLNVPKFSQKTNSEDNLDKTLYGHYLVIACRHKLTPDNKHETIFEACTNSSNKSDSKNKMISSKNYENFA